MSFQWFYLFILDIFVYSRMRVSHCWCLKKGAVCNLNSIYKLQSNSNNEEMRMNINVSNGGSRILSGVIVSTELLAARHVGGDVVVGRNGAVDERVP